MSYKTQYVHLPDDKSEHIIGDGQRTECGVPIPYGSDWTTEAEGSVCSACKKNAGKADEAQAAVDVQHEAEVLRSAAKAAGQQSAEAIKNKDLSVSVRPVQATVEVKNQITPKKASGGDKA